MRAQTKLIIFGIDAATWDLMDPWLDGGSLPNLAAVIRDGCRAPLRSVVPPITGCAWPTIMTGVNPGKHGMFGLSSYDTNYQHRPVSNLDRRVPALWDRLAELGLSVGVYNVPMTYPPNEINGYMVSGEMGAVEFDRSMFRPRELFEELARVVPDYVIAPLKRDDQGYDLDALKRQVEARRKAAVYLLEKHPVDVFIAVVNYVDYVQHFFMKSRACGETEDLVLWAYQQADQLLGELMEVAGEHAAVMVLSDHGAGPVSGFLDLNALLAQLGFLQVPRPAGQRPSVKSALRKGYRTVVRPLLSEARQKKLRKRFAGLPFEPSGTRAYQAGPYLCVRLNLKGREARGWVPAGDYDRVCSEIVQALNEVVNPFSGEKDLGAFAAADYYSGPHTALGPDILGMAQGFALDRATIPGNVDRPFLSDDDLRALGSDMAYREGTHRADGIFACRLPSRAVSLTVEHPGLADMVPTALSLLSLPVPMYLDGRAVLDLPEERVNGDERWEAESEAPAEAYTDEERKKVQQRLRDLGYL